jgi:hypothetical protein
VRQNTRRAALLPPQDETTVVFDVGNRPLPPAAARPALPADGVTVCVPGAVLAPAPTPEGGQARDAPVFVDESGARKRLLRVAGLLIALISVGFLAIVGVALAVPSVAISVGLGDVLPFMIPGAAAPPAPKAPPAPHDQVAKPTPKPKPAVVAAPTTKPKPADIALPTSTPAPTTEAASTQAPVTRPPVTRPPVTQAPVTQPPVTQAPVTQPPVTQAPVTQAPVTQAP